MKRLAVLSLLLNWFSFLTNAQNILPPQYNLSNDTVDQVTLPDSAWQILKDTTGKWTIRQVTSLPLASNFHRNNGLDYSVSTYWIRYRLKNDLNHEASITIGSNAVYYDLYVADENAEWQHYKSGNYVPWSKRDGIKRFGSIPLNLEAGKEVLVYKRIEYDFKAYRPVVLSTSFWFVNHDNNSEYLGTIRNTFLFGIFFLTAIINFFFFWVARERVYLYYALAMFFASLLYFYNPLFIIFFKEHPKAFNYVGQLFVTCLLFFLVHTFRHFLLTFDHYPRWDKILIIIGLIPVFTLGSVFFFGVIPFIWSLLQGVIYLTLFITCLFSVRKKDKVALLIIMASLPTLIFLGILGLANTLQPSLSGSVLHLLEHWIPAIELLVQFWSISIFSWILAHRYQKLQKQIMEEAIEKERLSKQKEIEHSLLITRQKQELEIKVAERTAELKQSLEDLKTTQWQLIQSEKMASLGELTAGIAHEIQNPLNFVNNFSEVTVELGEEMKGELHIGKIAEAQQISSVISDNLRKILHHGKRADAIVRSMLQHSRKSVGEKQLSDLNALADEYLRLSYHGFRVKDKTFNVQLHIDFDENIGKIYIVPQDISRVLINLFNNAFYSVSRKQKLLNCDYQPAVWLRTKKLDNTIEIVVKDNGLGISERVKDKMFQPFFTTKPTGEGTGLGLSLSYDIITNEHGGVINLKTKEGEYAEFTVLLPMKKMPE